MIHRRRLRKRRIQSEASRILKSFIVEARDVAAHLVPFIKEFELFVEHRSLQRIKARIVAEDIMLIFADSSVVSQFFHPFCKEIIVRNNGSRIPIRSQIFPRIKTECSQSAK